MDDSTFNAYREKIGTTLTLRLNDAYSQKVLSEDETPVVARFILDHIDKVQNHEDLLKFLEELANKWPLFGPILITEQQGDVEGENQETANKIEQLIKDDKIEEALKVAEDTNHMTEEYPPQQTGGAN